MNKELEEAKKKLHDGIVAYIRAAYKATGSVEISVLMLAKDFGELGEKLTEEDFAGLEDGDHSEVRAYMTDYLFQQFEEGAAV